MTNQQKFIEIFGQDAWIHLIVETGIAMQFKEYWTSPYIERKIFTGYYDANQNPIYVGDIIQEGCNGIISEVIKNPNCKGGYGLEGCGESYCIADASIEWEKQEIEECL